jgi:membrane-associated phospholipid phosphatase
LIIYLANTGTIIPALAAIGIVFLVFGWKVGGRGAIWLAVGASCLSAVAVLLKTVIVSSGPPNSVRRIFLRPPDTPMHALHSLGVTNGFIVGFAAVTLILLILAEPRRDRAVLTLGFAGAVLVLALALRSFLGGGSFAHPLVQLGAAPHGFPSGHVARATLLSWLVLRRMPWLATFLVICMTFSVVYLGDHWMSQALGGVWLGIAGAEIGASVWRWLGEERPESELERDA